MASKTTSAPAEKGRFAKAADAVTDASKKVGSGAKTAAIAARNGAVTGAGYVRDKSVAAGGFAKEKWDGLTPEQRKGTSIAAGAVLGLLVLKRLIFGGKKRKEKRSEEEYLRKIKNQLGVSPSFSPMRPTQGSAQSTPMTNSRTPAAAWSPSGPKTPPPSSHRDHSAGKSLFGARAGKIAVLEKGSAVTTTAPNEFSVATYNVLSDFYGTSKRHSYVAPEYMKYDYRFALMRKQIETMDADIVCLQEIDPNSKWLEWRRFMRARGYDGTLQDKDASRSVSVAVATFWKADKFECLQQDHKARSLILHLRWRERSSKSLWVVNCHLEGHVSRPHERVLQARSILSALVRAHQAAPKGAAAQAVVWAGDINGAPDSGVIKLLVEGALDANSTEPGSDIILSERALVHPYRFRDAYHEALAAPPFTRKVPGNAAVLDYVLATTNTLETLAVVKPMTARERLTMQRGNLPSRDHPSDHLPLAAVFRQK
ncbi:unnamed protein product [Pedinophyceae sp. YPF-701]|nr:unnamed protein product [Pedinophyceae sp. YPF-701]